MISRMAGSGGLSRRRRRANRRNIREGLHFGKAVGASRMMAECRMVDLEDLGVVMRMVLLILGRRDLVSSR